ncbi:MAG: type II toxin-antitoxin system VapC family toxin [Euzebya sp.]
MSLLLDTRALLWWLRGDEMTDQSLAAIGQDDALIYVSAASIWEAELKSALGKLEVHGDLVEEAAIEGFEPLAITHAHGRRAGRLPPLHRDPFDRMLVAQAQEEGLRIVTRDPAIAAYDVDVLRC